MTWMQFLSQTLALLSKWKIDCAKGPFPAASAILSSQESVKFQIHANLWWNLWLFTVAGTWASTFNFFKSSIFSASDCSWRFVKLHTSRANMAIHCHTLRHWHSPFANAPEIRTGNFFFTHLFGKKSWSATEPWWPQAWHQRSGLAGIWRPPIWNSCISPHHFSLAQRSLKILVRHFWTTGPLWCFKTHLPESPAQLAPRSSCHGGQLPTCCSSTSCPSNHSILLLTRSTVVHWLHWDFLFTLSSSQDLKMDH